MRRVINSSSLRIVAKRVTPASTIPSLSTNLFSTKVEALPEPPKDTILGKLGLDDWKMAIPAAMFVGIPAIHNEVFTIDAEFQVCACFVLFCSTCYTQLGPMLDKSLSETTDQVTNQMKALDDAIESQIASGIEQSSAVVNLEKTTKLMFDTNDTIYAMTAENNTKAEKYMLRDAVAKRLDQLNALEESVANSVRNRMLKSVNADVLKTFTNDKKAKEETMAQAIAVLTGNGKLGKDVVGTTFTSALKKYKDDYAKIPADKDEILIQLEKDMAALCTEIKVGAGGNVYNLEKK